MMLTGKRQPSKELTASMQFLRGIKGRWNVKEKKFRHEEAARMLSLTPEIRDRWFFELSVQAKALGLMDEDYNWYEDRLTRVLGYDEIGSGQFECEVRHLRCTLVLFIFWTNASRFSDSERTKKKNV